MAHWRLVIGGVGAWAVVALPAFAQQTDVPAPPPADPSATTTVVVQGQRSEVSDRIDRRVYTIKDDPDAQAGTAGDILDKLPSVTINPAGQVTLRGNANVTVLVDGKAPANGNNFIQTLSASDIDRVEIITNPSAHYQTDGSGGIINIITRKHHPFGLSGTATGRDTSLGQAGGNASMSLTEGPWSVTGRVNAGRFANRADPLSTETAPDPFRLQSHQMSEGIYTGTELEGARKFGETQTVTLHQSLYQNWGDTRETDEATAADRDYTTQQDTRSRNRSSQSEVIYDSNNDTTGHHFTLDAVLGQNNQTRRVQTTDSYTQPTAGQAIYGSYERDSGQADDIRADFESHPKSGEILTAGLEWRRDGSGQADVYSDTGAIAGPYVDGGTVDFSGRRDITAGYVTWQHPLFGGWTMLPGLRVEYEALQIRSLGQEATPDDLQLYPTLHLSHDLGEGKIKLSYSRRVDRPSLNKYDPARVFTSAFFAAQGNPDLKAPTTDSWELGYDYSQDKTSTSATLYYHALSHAVSDFYQDLGNTLVLDRPINAGNAQSAGGELTVKRPLSKHWKMSLNVNLFYTEVPILATLGGATEARGAVSYVSNSSIEYDADTGDQVQLNLALAGRELHVQGYLAPVSHLDLTWRHNLTKKLALVVNAQDMLAGMRWVSVTTTPALRSRWVEPATDRLLRISLTRTFGGPK